MNFIFVSFRELALAYSTHHAFMSKKHEPCDNRTDDEDNFYQQGGITNGAAWYSVSGGTSKIITSFYDSFILWLIYIAREGLGLGFLS